MPWVWRQAEGSEGEVRMGQWRPLTSAGAESSRAAGEICNGIGRSQTTNVADLVAADDAELGVAGQLEGLGQEVQPIALQGAIGGARLHHLSRSTIQPRWWSASQQQKESVARLVALIGPCTTYRLPATGYRPDSPRPTAASRAWRRRASSPRRPRRSAAHSTARRGRCRRR